MFGCNWGGSDVEGDRAKGVSASRPTCNVVEE